MMQLVTSESIELLARFICDDGSWFECKCTTYTTMFKCVSRKEVNGKIQKNIGRVFLRSMHENLAKVNSTA